MSRYLYAFIVLHLAGPLHSSRAVVLHLPAGFYTTCSHVSAPRARVVRLCR